MCGDQTTTKKGVGLGGEGVVVEIDECKIGKIKFNRGRLVEGVWILGMINVG